MKALLAALALGFVFTSIPASAAAQIPKALSNTKYGVAGCGLGSMLFGDQPGAVQIVAATTNGTSANQTFGITSGTSNCGPGLIAQRATDFVKTNKLALQNDVAKGEGEALASFQQMMSCNNAGFAQAAKSSYQSIFAQTNDEAIASSLVSLCQI